jgi:hypothetical protein
MRVYFYSTETGVFQGEGFLEDDVLVESDGATTVAPPVYGNGEIPVFDAIDARWSICSTARARSLGMQLS